MRNENTSWRSKQIYCPNCRKLVTGYEGKDGITRMTCDQCGAIMIRKIMGRRHERIDVYAPCGQERI